MFTKMVIRLLSVWMMTASVFAASVEAPRIESGTAPISAVNPAELLLPENPAIAISTATPVLERFEGDLSVVEYTRDGSLFRMEKFHPANPIHMEAVTRFTEEKDTYYVVDIREIRLKEALGYYNVGTPFGEYIFFKNGRPVGTFCLETLFQDEETDALEKKLQADSEMDPTRGYRKTLEEMSLHSETLGYLKREITSIKDARAVSRSFYANLVRYLDPETRRHGGIGKIMTSMIRHLIIDLLVGKSCRVPIARDGKFVPGEMLIPFRGSISAIALDNLPSVASQLAGDEVSLSIMNFCGSEDHDPKEGFTAFVIFYPPRPEESSIEHLQLAKKVVTMEKAFKSKEKASYLDVAHSGGYSWL